MKRVVFLLHDDVNVLDVTGPLEVFSQACRMAADAPPYCIHLVSLHGGLIRTNAGLELMTEAVSQFQGSEIDTLLLAGGGRHYLPFAPQAVVNWIAAHAAQIRRVCSVCTGAFALAAAGMLAERRATTHWLAASELQRIAPQARIDADAIYICDGPVWTSAGVSAGIDLALALVEADLGHALVMQIARRMVVFLKRPGGQSQFSAPLAQQSKDQHFADLHAWIAGHLHEDLRVETLAARVNMTPRSFARHYRARLHCTPARHIEAMRLEVACGLLESGQATLKQIAARCGFGDEQNLRRAFDRQFGIAPLDYRQRFAHGV
jgi:transcriptional regulator GlxA family with amidase domain